ncbi:MAG: hypothetical protein KJZ95_12845 [Caldilinea sp.]|jgi:hypothetical protein|nr:hypothetical protein [Caldilinea sp.]
MQPSQQPIVQRKPNALSELPPLHNTAIKSPGQLRRSRLLIGLIVALIGLTGFLVMLAIAVVGG